MTESNYRTKVHEILSGPNNKKIGIHLPKHLDLTKDGKAYVDIHDALVKQNAGKAYIQTTTELTRGPKLDLHEYLYDEDPEYSKLCQQ